MFRKAAIYALLGLCLVPTMALAHVRIRIPRTVDPTHLTILEGSYERGLAVGPITTKKGVYEYCTDLEGAPLKLVLYCPGFKTVAVTFDSAAPPPWTFSPRFKRISMVPLRVRLTYSDGRPIANTRVVIRLFLNSHEYFGYEDGIAYMTDVATATTDANGEFRVRLPSLPDDPYFVKYSPRAPGFEVELPDIPYADKPWDLAPRYLKAQRSYPQTVQMQLIYKAKVSGTVTRSFLQKNDADVPMGVSDTTRGKKYRVSFDVQHGRSGEGTGVNEDGSFTIYLRPGTHDLSLVIEDEKGSTQKNLPIKSGVVLKEGEDYKVNFE